MTETRERHYPCCDNHEGIDPPVCTGCTINHGWPCDAIREADRADKAEAALAEMATKRDLVADEMVAARAALDSAQARARSTMLLYQAAAAERDAARADAERLAEALRPHHGPWYDDGGCICGHDPCDARAALAAHDEATK